MADEEDDYMGDLSQFLTTETLEPLHSSKKVSNVPTQSSNKKSKPQNWQQQRKFKRERDQEEEDNKTLENLKSAVIPQSNIGFKLLKQMGYQPGQALGKDRSGRVEPVGVEIRRTRAGVGSEDPREERRRRECEMAERDRRKHEDMAREFECRQKEQWRGKRVVVNFNKARAVLEQLEGKEAAEAVEPEEGEDNEEEEEEVITEEDLLDILVKLREEFQYCLFCGFRYESTEALLSNCPGLNEDDH